MCRVGRLNVIPGDREVVYRVYTINVGQLSSLCVSVSGIQTRIISRNSNSNQFVNIAFIVPVHKHIFQSGP